MRKLVGSLLCVLLLVFGIVVGAQATIYVGGFDYSNQADGWVLENGLISSSVFPSTAYPEDIVPNNHDSLTNVNYLVDYYNIDYSPSLPPITSGDKTEVSGDPITGTIPWANWMAYDYISLKYGNIVQLWNIEDLEFPGFSFDIRQGLSHYTLWNGRSVPEPTQMFLFGTGLIGIAAISRKKLFKQK